MAGDSHFRMLKVKCAIFLAIARACVKPESTKTAARQCSYSPTFYCCLMAY